MAISYISAASAASTSITIPTHQSGDLIVLIAFRSGSSTPPTVPSGQDWTTLSSDGSGGNSNNSAVLVYKFADSSSEASGTFTNATHISCAVYRGVLSIGDEQTAGAGSGTTTINFPALTLQVTDNTSWVVGLVGVRNASNIETAPSGMTNRTSTATSTESALHDTNGGVTSWSQQSITANSSGGYRAYTMELVAIPEGITATAGIATATATALQPLAYISFAQTVTSEVDSVPATANDANVTLGGVTATGGAGSASATGLDATVTVGPVTATAQAASAAATAPLATYAQTAQGGVATASATAPDATYTFVPPALDNNRRALAFIHPTPTVAYSRRHLVVLPLPVVLSAQVATATTGTATATGVQPTLVLGPVTATAGAASVNAVGRNATASVGPLTVATGAASVTATGANATAIVAVIAPAGTASASAVALGATLVPGAVLVPANAASVNAVANNAAGLELVIAQPSAGSVQVVGVNATLVPGVVLVPATVATVTATAVNARVRPLVIPQAGSVTATGTTPQLNTTLRAQAATVLAVGRDSVAVLGGIVVPTTAGAVNVVALNVTRVLSEFLCPTISIGQQGPAVSFTQDVDGTPVLSVTSRVAGVTLQQAIADPVSPTLAVDQSLGATLTIRSQC